MRIKFTKITIENFMSFGHVELKLSDRGFVLVKGVNNVVTDNARSNGAGKTTIFHALCWALTGQSLTGVKSNLTNNMIDDGCFVEVEFECDNKKYKVLRSKEHSVYKTDLSIIVNGEDKSGKGIRESEKILNQLLPDLTHQLIGSVVLLGKGMPQRLTNNTPSGRKELLETLSKSDFMIEDIKTKLVERKDKLEDSKRKLEDEILICKTDIKNFQTALNKATYDLSNLKTTDKLEEELQEVLYNINIRSSRKAELESCIEQEQNKEKEALVQKQAIDMEHNKEVQSIEMQKFQEVSSLKSRLSQYNSTLNSKKAERTRLLSIKDVCPTCGQKIPGVIKPDTSNLDLEINDISTLIEKTTQEQRSIDNIFKKQLDEVECIYKENLSKVLVYDKTILNNARYELKTVDCEQLQLVSEKSQIEMMIESHKAEEQHLKDMIDDYQHKIEEINEKMLYINNNKEELESRLKYVSKLTTLANRDFRGYLLKNVVDFIDSAAKNYALQIFGNDNINFCIDGNNLDISFSKKMYENLSSGEQQKVDLIIQLSLRDMLCKYMNFECNILALDEVFDGLDALGSERIMNLINNLTDIESVFIITHHTNDIELSYDDTIEVVKNSSGISEILQ